MFRLELVGRGELMFGELWNGRQGGACNGLLRQGGVWSGRQGELGSGVFRIGKLWQAISQTCFEWDDEKAAHKYRITQAQNIIRAIVVVDEAKQPETRAFVNVQREYHPVSVVVRNPEKREILLQNALNELRWFERKYNTLHELSNVFAAIEEVTK